MSEISVKKGAFRFSFFQNLYTKTNVGANLVFALRTTIGIKPMAEIKCIVSYIGSFPVFVRGQTQGLPLQSFSYSISYDHI